MTGCKKIDMETWARREHYEYYTKQLKVEYNITANVDVKNVLDFCHSKGYKFYPAMIYLVTKTLNRIENFKMFKDKKDIFAPGTKSFQIILFFIMMTILFLIAGQIFPKILIYFIKIS